MNPGKNIIESVWWSTCDCTRESLKKHDCYGHDCYGSVLVIIVLPILTSVSTFVRLPILRSIRE